MKIVCLKLNSLSILNRYGGLKLRPTRESIRKFIAYLFEVRNVAQRALPLLVESIELPGPNVSRSSFGSVKVPLLFDGPIKFVVP